MLKYLVKRLLTVIPIFFGITAIIYVLLNMAPGSALDILVSSEANTSPEQLEALKASLGLDQPVLIRYLGWLGDILRGDFGVSYYNGQEVLKAISQRIMPSVILTGTGVVLAILLSLPLGIMAAYKPYSLWDKASNVIALSGSVLPNFFLSLVLVYVFALKLKILPSMGMHTGTNTSFGDLVWHLVLPSFVICFGTMGSIIKQTRGACLEVFNEEYMKTARSKGISEVAVVIRHGFRNALIPVVTTVLLQIPHIIGGSTITEQIFGWPGIGSQMMSAINNRDYPMVMGIAVILALTVLATNILLDIVYGLVDPRISYE